MTGASRAIVSENLWRAQRDGVRSSFIDEATGNVVSCEEYLNQLLDQIAEDAIELECVAEAEQARRIIASGTSAEHQLKAFASSKENGVTDRYAVVPVVDWIAQVTAGH